jgi:glucans biosynthesis protein
LIERRTFVASLAGTLALSNATWAHAQQADLRAQPFDADMLIGRARDLASRDFVDDRHNLPKELADLDYDAVRDIRFRPQKSFLADGGSGFRLQFFHLSPLAPQSVDIFLVRDGKARRVAYDGSLFDYGRNKFSRPLPRSLGFAGLRIHYPVNQPDVLDELAVFLGATYFRFLGRGQHYGLSARALAINSGGVPEEFPFFRELFVEEPKADALSITLHGLFDSPSACGSCSFTIYPQENTYIDAVVNVIPRVEITRLGIAPLTSMFFAGETDRRALGEFRREIHDSDGLAIETGTGERIWRPLRNPKVARTSSFDGNNIRGYGLMQRERDWSDYSDLEAIYEHRPNYWVAPQGDWGAGRLELLELSAPEETIDNIVAFWNPQSAPEPQKLHRFAYQLRASLKGNPQATATVRNTFFSELPDREGHKRRMFIIDFEGGDLAFWLKEIGKVEAIATAAQGAVTSHKLVANPYIKGMRVFLEVAVTAGETCDMRVFLRVGPRALSETWIDSWTA